MRCDLFIMYFHFYVACLIEKNPRHFVLWNKQPPQAHKKNPLKLVFSAGDNFPVFLPDQIKQPLQTRSKNPLKLKAAIQLTITRENYVFLQNSIQEPTVYLSIHDLWKTGLNSCEQNICVMKGVCMYIWYMHVGVRLSVGEDVIESGYLVRDTVP